MYKVLKLLFDKDNPTNKFYLGDIVDFEDEERAKPLIESKVIEKIEPYIFKATKEEKVEKKNGDKGETKKGSKANK